MMKRRELITLLGGAAAAPMLLPRVARAQQPAMPVIGFLHSQSPDGFADQLRGFRRGLKEAGFVEGENMAIEYRWAENQNDRLPALAADLVRRRVAVITVFGNDAALTAKAAVASIPVVFSVGDDPVKLGLVASLARPGGNLTGVNFFTNELVAKRLEILRELVPKATRVGVLVNPASLSAAEAAVRDAQAAARALGLKVNVLKAASSREINEVFAGFERDRPDALLVSGGPFFQARRVQLTQLAAFHRVPATYAVRQHPEVGGLMSYGASNVDAWRQVAIQAGRILKGAKPAELPVVQSTKFELVINAETARMLGLTVPATLLATADEVIE
jgi:putative ABC transport system substrate-binding protein